MYDDIREQVLAHLLTEFPVRHPVAYLEAVVKDFLSLSLSHGAVHDFWAKAHRAVVADVVQEFNRREELGLPLRYELADDIGTKIRGRVATHEERVHAAFQEAILAITPGQFEQLSARILQWAGCTSFWSTPESHDEGLDAFGTMPLDLPAPDDPDADLPEVVMLAQAKHYSREKVGSAAIRELVGSAVLAKFRVYSTAAEKYTQLQDRPFAPTALFMITSGEVTRTARGLALRAGVFLVTGYDILSMLNRRAPGIRPSVARFRQALHRELRGIATAT